MTLDLGTRIGADGKRWPIGEDVPDNSDDENRAVLPIFGVPASGEVPVWNVDKRRLEWGPGGGGDTYDEIQLVIVGLTAAVEEVNDLPPRVDALEDTRVSSTTITTIERVTQAAYDLLDPPDADTLYVIVAA